MNGIDLRVVLAGISSVFPAARVTLETCHMRRETFLHIEVQNYHHEISTEHMDRRDTARITCSIVADLAVGIAGRAMKAVYQ